MNLKDIEKDINDRNFKNYSIKCEARVHMYSSKRSNLQSVILEVPADIYKNIRKNHNKVFVDFQRCRVFDVIMSNHAQTMQDLDKQNNLFKV